MFRRLVEHAHEGIIVLDAAGLVTYANPRFAELVGRSVDALRGRPVLEFVQPDDADVARTHLAARRAGVREAYEIRLVRDDGSVVWARISGSPLFDDDGTFTGSVALVTDTTERRRIEEELRRTRALLEAQVDERTAFLESLVENIPDMIFVKDAEELRFVRFNRAGEELLGLPREALIGKNDHDLFPQDEADAFTAADRAVLASGSVLDIAEEPIHTRAGERVLHTKKIPILRPDGRPAFLLGISEDVTVRRQADAERLRRVQAESARTRSELLSEASRALATTHDAADALQVLANRVVRALGGACLAAVRTEEGGLRIVGAADEADDEAWRDEVVGRRLDPDAPAALLDGADVTALPLERREERLGMLVHARHVGQDADPSLLRDLADRGTLALENALLHEANLRAVRVRDEFVSVAAHELRTPLTAIRIQLELLLRLARSGKLAQLEPERLDQLGASAEGAVRRFSRLVESLLDVSRIGAGRLALHPEPVELVGLVRGVLEHVQGDVDASGCTVELDAPAPVEGEWDAARVEQVVVNLVTNALKFGRGKPVRISVRGDDQGAELTVRDQGIGIAAKDLPRLFGRFQRAVSERNFGGLGLGLYIGRELVEAHGGTLTVESAPGEGATFRMRLPRTTPLTPPTAPRTT